MDKRIDPMRGAVRARLLAVVLTASAGAISVIRVISVITATLRMRASTALVQADRVVLLSRPRGQLSTVQSSNHQTGMDLEDVLELGGLGLLFGGLEIVGAVLSIALVLVLIAGLVAAFLWLDFGAVQLVVVLGLMIVAALLGGLGGMKIEQARRRFTDKYSADINDWT